MSRSLYPLLLLLAACEVPGFEPDDSALRAPEELAERKATPEVEVCDGRDNDHDGVSDEDCRSCDMVVTRTAVWWVNHPCVVDGGAVGRTLVPVTVGTVTMKSGRDVSLFVRGHRAEADPLADQLLAAKLNRGAFGSGGAIVGDVDGDGDRETLDEAIPYAEALYATALTVKSGHDDDEHHNTGEHRGIAKDKPKVDPEKIAHQVEETTKLLRGFNASGRRLATWFDETCKASIELCNGLDDDLDGQMDEGCLCGAALPADPCPGGEVASYYQDLDGDGFGGTFKVQACGAPAGFVDNGDDCDDADAAVHPEALETCDGADQDCDGMVDEDPIDGTSFYADLDGDGFGGFDKVSACEAPAGFVDNGEDCDDARADVFPNAPETCDGADQDCDAVVDEDPIDGTSFYADTDGDGFGGTQKVSLCDAPAGFVANGDDCDDARPDTFPNAAETCDGADQDCDGVVDEDPIDGTSFYADTDGDGFGGIDKVSTCTAPAGFVANGDDCDDARVDVFPEAPETCDGADQDCDGVVDEDPIDGLSFYADLDGDGFGGSDKIVACEAPVGFVDNGDDCDDSRDLAFPGALETCDGADEDCDGEVDEDPTDGFTFFVDADGDGFGGLETTLACSVPQGYTDNADDCDDAHAEAHPGAAEVCDGLDNDCDGALDEDDAVDATVWYLDVDADGYGNDAVPHRSCIAPAGYAAEPGDCDDREARANPGAIETCDTLDNDCDGTADEPDAEGAVDLHADVDLDGHGDPDSVVRGCLGAAGAVEDDSDCDDTIASVHPGATEFCNGRDDDCNGEVDVDAVDMRIYYLDGDADGYGDPEVATEACRAPEGYATKNTDCDDAEAGVYPGSEEVCDGVDQDCDGEIDDRASDFVTWYADLDGDGHGSADVVAEACEAPEHTAALDDDCDDTEAARFPGNEEVCDGLDNDCDTRVDLDVVDMPVWYRDNDGDGYGRESSATTACTPPEGWVADATDCNDNRASVHPDAADACNAVDDDCDGAIDEDVAWTAWFADEDGDGFGDAEAAVSACELPDGYVADNTDCDDHRAESFPAAAELCDGRDNDCDGTVDDEDAVAWVDWYYDGDNDGYGDVALSTSACRQPRGYVAEATDCDDVDETTHPGAVEPCDGLDNDCDGTIDEVDPGATTEWYTDADRDGHGDPAAPIASCIPLPGIVEFGDDCDDTDERVSPEADELCNTLDDDCDGETDEADAIDPLAWYADLDGDGYGGTAVQWSCASPDGYVAADGDCDDSDAARAPGVDELCNGVDDDCDAETDEGSALDATVWYADADGDGVGSDTRAKSACTQPEGWLASPGDCDDGAADVHPGGTEVCNDTDDDCDGEIDEDAVVGARSFYADADADGYGSLEATLACSTPEGYLDVSGDCDDNNRQVNPGATEVCNDVDDNCDGATDGADAAHKPAWYPDADGDGWGDASTVVNACTAPVGYVGDRLDCDDAASAIHPGAEDVCSDGVDDDCDGVQTWCGPYGHRQLAEGDAVFPGLMAGDGAGRSLAMVPDLDGDGHDDVVIGGIGVDGGASNGGGAYVFTGAQYATASTTSATATVYGTAPGGFLGRSVAGPGDVDGDGFGDLLIGAYNDPAAGFEAGAAYLFRGPVVGTHPAGDASARLLAESDGDWAGYAVAGAGDTDGDGRPDLLVAAPYQDEGGSRAGAVYLWSGTPMGDVSLGEAVKFVGEAALDRAGSAMAGLGDVDGDGLADVAVGAWSDNTAATKAGAVYLVYGAQHGTVDLSLADAKLRGEARDQRAGIAVAGPGDMDGDGLADVLVGADQAPAAYVVTGAPTGTLSLTSASAKLKGEDVLGHAGWAVDGAGDVDGDGARDLLVGAYAQGNAGSATGVAYLVCGPVSGTVLLKNADGRLAGTSDGDQAGYALSGGRDIDGDGLSDLLVGAWSAHGGGVASGEAYLFYGAER